VVYRGLRIGNPGIAATFILVVYHTSGGSDLPYFADRRAIIIANWFPKATVRQMLFEQRDHWFGGRKLGAVVDCAVNNGQRIDPNLEPIRDTLEQEQPGKTIEITGSFYRADVNPPKCKIFVPQQ
jgi:hypothetical protein